jgi:riboflavin biosynthesis pyrimidine reductase
MVRWNASTEHVKTQRLIDSVHLTLAPVLLGQGRPAVARLDLHGFCVTDRKASEYAAHFVLEKVTTQS